MSRLSRSRRLVRLGRRSPDVTREDLIEVVRQIIEGDPQDQPYYLMLLDTNVVHPCVGDLIFHPPAEMVDASPEHIVDIALSHRPIVLGRVGPDGALISIAPAAAPSPSEARTGDAEPRKIRTCAVVPVGLHRYRDRMPRPLDPLADQSGSSRGDALDRSAVPTACGWLTWTSVLLLATFGDSIRPRRHRRTAVVIERMAERET